MFETEPPTPVTPQLHQIQSLTQKYSPRYRKNHPFLKRSKKQEEKTVQQQYKILKTNINRLQEGLNNRMKVHEDQLIQIFNTQVKKILEDVKNIVRVYNKMINQKNLSEDLWETRNQAEFFKNQAERLFKENSYIKKQAQYYKRQNNELKYQIQCNNKLVHKLKYRQMKLKVKRQQSLINIKTPQKIDKTANKRNQTYDYQISQNKQTKLQSSLPHISLNSNAHTQIKTSNRSKRCISQNAQYVNGYYSSRKNVNKLQPFGKIPKRSSPHINIYTNKMLSYQTLQPKNEIEYQQEASLQLALSQNKITDN